MLNLAIKNKAIFIFLTIFLTFSCSSKEIDPNKEFNQKYLNETKKIYKDISDNSLEKFVTKKTNFGVINQKEYVSEMRSKNTKYFPYYDLKKIGDKPLRNSFPDQDSYQNGISQNPSNSIPSDIFNITYNERFYPAFKRYGASFDNIIIPKKDKYDIGTNFNKKNYLLVGNDHIQKSINQIKASNNNQDIDF